MALSNMKPSNIDLIKVKKKQSRSELVRIFSHKIDNTTDFTGFYQYIGLSYSFHIIIIFVNRFINIETIEPVRV